MSVPAKETTYKGDSPGKKLIRFRAWIALREFAEASRIPYRGTLVLAGEGGDLAVLNGLGFDMSTVTAVDRDPFLIDWCKDDYPTITGIAGDLADVASLDIPYNTAHIDFCGGISVDNILTAANIMGNAYTHPAVFAVTMLKGREYLGSTGLMKDTPRARRRRLMLDARKKGDAFGEHIYSNKKLDPRLLLASEEARFRAISPEMYSADQLSECRMMTRKGKLGPLGTAMLRVSTMHRAIEHVWNAQGIDQKIGLPPDENLCIQQVGTLAYHSGTSEGGGTPFVTGIYIVYRTSQWPQVAWAMQNVPLPYRAITLKQGLEGIKPTIASLARVMDHAKVAEIFGLKASSIPALVAHDSRGSYGAPLIRSKRIEVEVPEGYGGGWGSSTQEPGV